MDGSKDQAKDELQIASMLRQLVAAIVDHPAQVAVSSFRDSEDLHFIVEVASEDLDRLHGPNSRTAESLSVVVKAAGLKSGHRCRLQFEAASAGRNQAAKITSGASSK